MCRYFENRHHQIIIHIEFVFYYFIIIYNFIQRTLHDLAKFISSRSRSFWLTWILLQSVMLIHQVLIESPTHIDLRNFGVIGVSDIYRHKITKNVEHSNLINYQLNHKYIEYYNHNINWFGPIRLPNMGIISLQKCLKNFREKFPISTADKSPLNSQRVHVSIPVLIIKATLPLETSYL